VYCSPARAGETTRATTAAASRSDATDRVIPRSPVHRTT
jgi:hypothetical protein